MANPCQKNAVEMVMAKCGLAPCGEKQKCAFSLAPEGRRKSWMARDPYP